MSIVVYTPGAAVEREVERLRKSSASVPPSAPIDPGFRLTPRWYPLRPHGVQRAYWFSVHRFNTLPCGRRSGKSEIAKRRLVKRAIFGTKFDRPRFFYGAPTRDQAKRIAWEDLKRFVPEWAIADEPRETDLSIPLWHRGELVVVGMDRPERIEGSPWDGGVLDEYANMKAKAWSDHVRPVMSDRAGWCDFIGVPEGRNHYYELDRVARARMLEQGAASDWGAFHWRSEDILPAAEVAAAREDLDELTFEQEYGGSFVTFQGRIYYVFEEKQHCARLFDRYDPDAPIIFCFDFNVSPGVAAVAQEMELPPDAVTGASGQVGTGFIGEVWIPRNSNTRLVCRKLLQDWKDHRGKVVCYGDATGGAAGTAKVAGSDWEIITKMLRAGDADANLPGFGDRVSFRVPSANPPIRSRVNAVNSRLKSTSGVVRMMVDPSRAPHLQKDFEGVRVVEGSSGDIDEKSDPQLVHISTAAGYYVAHQFPVVERAARTTELRL